MAKSVAGVYSQALFELAREKDPETFLREAEGLLVILKENPDFSGLLAHPRITRAEKQEALEKVFGNALSPEFLGFLKLLVIKDRAGALGSILEEFLNKVREELGIGKVFVTSACPLDEGRRAALEERLLSATSYKRLEPEYRVDASLIGGMVVRIGDRIVDDSLKTKLYTLERELL